MRGSLASAAPKRRRGLRFALVVPILETMKAARLYAFGPLSEDSLRVGDLELPPPGPGEIAVEMLAAPINPADLNIIEGTYGQLPDLPAIIGNEGAGRAVAVGSGIANIRPGDLVATLDPGAWTQRRNVPVDRAILLPEGTDPQQAAMMVINPASAYLMLRDYAPLKPNDWVAINAANSGVGRAVIQIALQFGFRTLCLVRREELIPELTALGADRVILEGTDLRKEGRELMEGAEARLALNAVGGASALNLANALAPGSTMVTYGAMSRQPLKLPNGLLIFKGLSFQGFWLRRWFGTTSAADQQEVFRYLAELTRDRSLQTPVHRTYRLEDIHAAIKEAASENRGGKVLLDLAAG